jgi:glucuronate isomerase
VTCNLFLKNPLAKEIYLSVRDLPIYDYHCHLSAEEILTDLPYCNLGEIWLKGDHYKWRLMRIFGVDEFYITGGADIKEKFFKFIGALERAAGNPLYTWCALELKKYFDCDLEISVENAEKIWQTAAAAIQNKRISPRKILELSDVEAVSIVEDVYSRLETYEKLKGVNLTTRVLPSFRGDKALNIENENFGEWVKELSLASGVKIGSLSDFKAALSAQLKRFKKAGAVNADFAVEYILKDKGLDYAEEVFAAALMGESVSEEAAAAFKANLLKFLMSEVKSEGLAVLLHIGALRNCNTKAYFSLGADSGFDAISERGFLSGLKSLLDDLGEKNALGRTVVFNLDPAANERLSALLGCFAGESLGKVQLGAAWWFSDTRAGILNHLRCFSELSNLGAFLGMLTDSRSFTSFVRHDYFRRLLSLYLSELKDSGEFSGSAEALKKIAADISYHNAVNFFETK